MTAVSALLNLPSELRSQIWNHIFHGLDATTNNGLELPSSSCKPCQGMASKPLTYASIALPLLTCKQLHSEAAATLHNTVRIHLVSPASLEKIRGHTSLVKARLQRLTLYLHYDDTLRYDWIKGLGRLESIFPSLRNLTIFNHMRPPNSYDHLVDSIYMAGPVVNFSLPIQTKFHFDYVVEEVMFSSAILGDIRCSDALEEHELVVRDLLVDEDFKKAAQMRDLNLMTGALLRIARAHEQPWFEKLGRRRALEAQRDADGAPAQPPVL